MKKLLLVTGIFLSLGLMASAQQKKSVAHATTNHGQKNKKTLKTFKMDRKAQKIETEQANGTAGAAKKGSAAPQAKETKSN